MRIFFYVILTLLLVGCSGNGVPSRSLVVDLNGTSANIVKVYNMDNLDEPVDSAAVVEGQYHFDVTRWPYGFYRMVVDSANTLDMVVGDMERMMVCARRNHMLESTTNSVQTRHLWQVMALQRRLESDSLVAPVPADRRELSAWRRQSKDSLLVALSVMRDEAEIIRRQIDTSLVLLPLLNLGTDGLHVYNIYTDHALFESASEYLANALPGNDDVVRLRQQVIEARLGSLFFSKYVVGCRCPSFTLNMSDGTSMTSADVEGGKCVMFYTSDTISALWPVVQQKRLAGCKVVASVPAQLAKATPLRPGLFVGRFKSSDEEMFRSVQPLVVTVGDDGRIVSVVPCATVNDVY